MSRLVIPKNPGLGLFAAKSVREREGDDYKGRLLKYIPAESVALYALTDKMFKSYYGLDAAGSPTKAAADWVFSYGPEAVFLICMMGTPIYLFIQRAERQPWGVHAFISTVAFGLWAYTLEGSVFVVHQCYHVLLAALLAPVFTFVAGWFEPKY